MICPVAEECFAIFQASTPSFMHWWSGEGWVSWEDSETGVWWSVLHMVSANGLSHFLMKYPFLLASLLCCGSVCFWLHTSLILTKVWCPFLQCSPCPSVGNSAAAPRIGGSSFRGWYSPQVLSRAWTITRQRLQPTQMAWDWSENMEGT